MSESHNQNSSSSDESEDFRSNIQMPNLANYRKQKQNKKNVSRTNLANAGKKLKGVKAVRFPDSYEPRQSMMSTTSNSSSNSDFSVDDNAIVPNLPSFSLENQNLQNQSKEEESEEEASDSDANQQYHNVDYHSSSSDDDDNDNENENKHNSNGETDITDQLNDITSTSSSNNITNEKQGGLKGILRKMSLVDQNYSVDPTSTNNTMPAPSNSDTFLGRVLSFSNDLNIGLGGSRNSKDDEENNIGLDDNAEAIEMKKMDFKNLNKEARNLISAHVPEAAHLMMISEHSSEENLDHDTSNNNLDDTDGEEANSSPKSKSKSFYAPNPDYFQNTATVNDADNFMLDEDEHDNYIAPPKNVHAGVLSSLLKLYQNPQESKSSNSLGTYSGSTLTGNSTLSESMLGDHHDDIIDGSRHASTLDLNKLKKGITSGPRKMANKLHIKKKPITSKENQAFSDEEADAEIDESEKGGMPSFQNARPKAPKKAANVSADPSMLAKKLKKKKKLADRQLRITVHIADILQRQRFIIRMCRALMLFGAPTHRLEEYMVMTSRVLEIDGQFVYFPGCMIISFGDTSTRTSEVHLVRCAQGLNLSKLSDTHKIYKGVIHDLIGVEDAAIRLDDLLKRKNLYPPWFCVFSYGLGSAMVCPYAFDGYWTDIPIAFGVGLCVGYLQFFVSSMSMLYSSVFEVTASIVVSFIARAIGSIHNGDIFCFSAIAQGSLAIILPGYIILCGSLELQSRNLVAGSVRMFYAIIYSLFLGFGITLGSALYGWIDKNSVSSTTCSRTVDAKFRILFVPAFSISLALINQARLTQLPVMVCISSCGYIATYFAGKHFSEVTEFTACIGSFIVGILGNLYSRIWKGMAVSAMLPAIFVQVPSGIASQSSLLAGVQSANAITKGNSTSSTSSASSTMSFGATMVEVSIGISVGLFAAALVVYPFGKKRTGLFSL